MVRRNLLLADWCDDHHKESLLNKKNSKWAREMLDNVRQACCLAGACLSDKDPDLHMSSCGLLDLDPDLDPWAFFSSGSLLS